ncbi:MAG: hypothetical protein MZU79_08820 [Anaerotruncus sp.]|nr:hypothetical protein [Anaerotruncus sp.]
MCSGHARAELSPGRGGAQPGPARDADAGSGGGRHHQPVLRGDRARPSTGGGHVRTATTVILCDTDNQPGACRQEYVEVTARAAAWTGSSLEFGVLRDDPAVEATRSPPAYPCCCCTTGWLRTQAAGNFVVLDNVRAGRDVDAVTWWGSATGGASASSSGAGRHRPSAAERLQWIPRAALQGGRPVRRPRAAVQARMRGPEPGLARAAARDLLERRWAADARHRGEQRPGGVGRRSRSADEELGLARPR